MSPAVLNGTNYFTDPRFYGYELLEYSLIHTYEWYWDLNGPCGLPDYDVASISKYDWSSASKMLNEEDICIREYICQQISSQPLEYSYVDLCGPPVYTSEYRSNPAFDVFIGSYTVDASVLGTKWYEFSQNESSLSYIKRWPTQELQLVILQFPMLEYRTSISAWSGTPSDPSVITYRGQEGFLYNGNVSFVVPIETEVNFTIKESDFTWPSFRTVWDNGHSEGRMLSFNSRISNHIVNLELAEATFQGAGEHELKTDDGTYESEGIGLVRTPQIKAGATPRETGICYTWESSPEIYATFNISPSLPSPVSAKIRIEGIQKGRSGTLIYEKDVMLSGSFITTAFTTSDKLKKLIDNTTFDLTWKISFDGGSSYKTIDTSVNKLFVTAGAPGGGNTTLTRIDRVTEECKGLVNEPNVVQELWEEVAGPAPYLLGAAQPIPEWKILDGSPGECIDIAVLFEDSIQMIGLTPGSGSVTYLYAGPSGGSHESSASDNFSTRNCQIGQSGHTGSIGNTHYFYNHYEKLIYRDMSGQPNNWEACYKYRHQVGDPWVWYAPGTSGASFSSVQECMDLICDETLWRYCKLNWDPLGDCSTPGPEPEHDW